MHLRFTLDLLVIFGIIEKSYVYLLWPLGINELRVLYHSFAESSHVYFLISCDSCVQVTGSNVALDGLSCDVSDHQLGIA